MESLLSMELNKIRFCFLNRKAGISSQLVGQDTYTLPPLASNWSRAPQRKQCLLSSNHTHSELSHS